MPKCQFGKYNASIKALLSLGKTYNNFAITVNSTLPKEGLFSYFRMVEGSKRNQWRLALPQPGLVTQ
jgi:hypothetical protein